MIKSPIIATLRSCDSLQNIYHFCILMNKWLVNTCSINISFAGLTGFISYHTYDNSKISDLVKLRSSHSKRFVNSFTSRISYKENEFLFLVTTRTVCETDGRKKPIKIIKEYHENTDSLLLFFLKKNLVFSPENGGRISKNYRIEFYKEKIFSGNDFSFFLIKKTFGNRYSVMGMCSKF